MGYKGPGGSRPSTDFGDGLAMIGALVVVLVIVMFACAGLISFAGDVAFTTKYFYQL